MKTRFIIISTITISVFALIWNAIVHLVILAEDNKALESIHRPDMADKLWLSIIVTVLIALLFNLSFIKWHKNGSIQETIIHSLFFALLMGVVVDLNQYVQYSIPFFIILKWFVFGVIEFIIYGFIANYLFNKFFRNHINS